MFKSVTLTVVGVVLSFTVIGYVNSEVSRMCPKVSQAIELRA